MKITIIGSSAFREKKVELYDELIKLGHKPVIRPHYIESVKDGKTEIMDRIDKGEHSQLKIENDYIKWYYNAIVSSDAVLVVNLDKNGQKNYIGGNTLIEIGFAYVNDKKIFMYNDLPLKEECKYLDEIEAMQPIIINQDLNKIK
ncbi:hypothetical protein HOD96_03795 [Candidatus Falkowbacteria bacterium]|jgi:hypothetical protein|nr:hypothetical protein [Candidatus Falkowbacteria bacterium]MBT4432898.1 hypothetical protein [Candidatus Falkowbacteria bacterium]